MIRSFKLLLVGGMAVVVSLIALLAILDQRYSRTKGSQHQVAKEQVQYQSPATHTSRARPEIPQREIAQQEIAQQEIAQQKIAQQQIAQQQIAQQEIAQQQITQQEIAQQEIAQQEIAQQEIAQQQRAQQQRAELQRAELQRTRQKMVRQQFARQRVSRQGFAPVSEGSKFTPIRSLYTLSNRACEDDDLSSLILQADLIKKDRRLAWQQHDIDDCNSMVLSYVGRGVRENESYYLRRKLVETFGQTSHTVLINRLRLVAVLLGGEKGSGGMDPVFTPIREEAHRISPYVLVLVRDYIAKLEQKMTRARIDRKVDKDFTQFVDSLGDSFQSEYGIANFGARNRNQPAKELYALKVLHRDLREYYGERVEGRSDDQRYEVIFSNPGSFKSDTLVQRGGSKW
jgi:hypothetical protein